VVVGAYTFWDSIWTLFVFFALLMFYTWVVLLLIDNFRRRDHSGLAKAGWAIFIIFLPIIGALSYTIARPDILTPATPYDVPAAPSSGNGSSSTAAELAQLSELRSEGAISDSEYEDLKRKTIATA
jgi:hypothetical protein